MKSEPIHLSVTEKPPVEVERPHQFSVSTNHVDQVIDFESHYIP